MSNSGVYMDHAATTPCDPRVVEAMLPYFTKVFGNPGSRNHRWGWESEAAVDIARKQVAGLIGADPKEVVFTSGATESNNLALKGAASMYEKAPAGSTGRGHIISCNIEHKAVLDPCKRLQKEGFDVTFVEPPVDGIVTRAMIEAAMRPDTILVSIMWANNEIGTINEVPAIGALCHERGIIFHTDATQWVGKMPTDLARMPIDLACLSAHKLHGPKGVGALYVRRGVALRPVQTGVQELGRRGGTENVPGIVGFGAAAELARAWLERPQERQRLAGLRDTLERGLLERVPGAVVIGPGDPDHRLWNTLSIAFPGLEAEAILLLLSERGVSASAGAACSSGSLDPSPVTNRRAGRPGSGAGRTKSMGVVVSRRRGLPPPSGVTVRTKLRTAVPSARRAARNWSPEEAR